MENGLSLGAELRFIFRHGFIQNRAVMQIISHFRQGPATFAELVEGEIEETGIIGLEVNLAIFPQEPCVAVEETAVRQAPFGMALLGPGIAEVDEEAHFLPA